MNYLRLGSHVTFNFKDKQYNYTVRLCESHNAYYLRAENGCIIYEIKISIVQLCNKLGLYRIATMGNMPEFKSLSELNKFIDALHDIIGDNNVFSNKELVW